MGKVRAGILIAGAFCSSRRLGSDEAEPLRWI